MQTEFDPNTYLGLIARSFSREVYEYKGTIDDHDGDLIIDFGTTSIWLSSVPPYDILAIKSGEWKDPFEGATDPETIQYLAEHGKWALRCCDSTPPFRECVGSKLVSISKLLNEYGDLAGLGFRFEGGSFYFYVGGDESLVDQQLPSGFTEL